MEAEVPLNPKRAVVTFRETGDEEVRREGGGKVAQASTIAGNHNRQV